MLHKSYKRTNYVKYTLSNKGIDILNNLEENYKNIRSIDSFKRLIKRHY